jgi:DNA-binding response OmpR family regulator
MPIIFITGYGDVPMTVQAMKAGAVEFLTKPFGDEVPLSAIGHALERSRSALHHEAQRRALRDNYAHPCMPVPGKTMTPICSTSSMASLRLNATCAPCGRLTVSRLWCERSDWVGCRPLCERRC